jgi:hypothetical protein
MQYHVKQIGKIESDLKDGFYNDGRTKKTIVAWFLSFLFEEREQKNANRIYNIYYNGLPDYSCSFYIFTSFSS